MMRFGRRLDDQLEVTPVVDTEAPAATKPLELAAASVEPAEVVNLAAPQRDLASATEVQLPRLRAQVLEMLDIGRIGTMSPEQLRTQIRAVVHGLANRERLQLSARDQDRLAQELAADMVGYGPLEALLQDERVTEVMINGPDRVSSKWRAK